MEVNEVINYLIDKHNYKSYLEIGVWQGKTFEQINIENKESCDVSDIYWYLDIPITYLMTSDEMFAKMPIDKKYDIIFIDGLHTEEQLDRDIINALKHLNPEGLILCHDVLPLDYFTTTEMSNTGNWMGTCWKSITKLQDQNISYYTTSISYYGLTIIKYHDNPYQLHYPNYKSNIQFEYVFNNIFKLDDSYLNYAHWEECLNMTDQGKYIMHYITDEEFYNLF